ncbi:MAG: hypothetical protein WAM72_06420, partial [Xanthobacteraceae bacterium]
VSRLRGMELSGNSSMISRARLRARRCPFGLRPVNMIVKAEGPSGRAKIHSDDPKHALGVAQYLRTIGYNAWIEDTNGNEVDEKALKMAISSRHEDAPSS